MLSSATLLGYNDRFLSEARSGPQRRRPGLSAARADDKWYLLESEIPRWEQILREKGLGERLSPFQGSLH